MSKTAEKFIDKTRPVWAYTVFTEQIINQFQSGKLHESYRYFGSHTVEIDGIQGSYFAVWAPAAKIVSVIGEFNGWKQNLHRLYVRQDSSGIWEGFIPHLPENSIYKYYIKGNDDSDNYKADPYAFRSELRPGNASITHTLHKQWKDEEWMRSRAAHNSLGAPWCVYEVHLGSFMKPDKTNPDGYTSYLDLKERLVPYVKGMGFTHVEIMPLMEYPYDGSWGYQCLGYFAATSRYGTPEELMELIEAFHLAGIGVIFDWVPSHFPGDAHGLYKFDGSHVYEYADTRKGYHPDWNSYIFNYKRGEVLSFLLSSAHFWFHYYHIDGVRVDAVNSIMRLDFGRWDGNWEPNEHGGNENLEGSAFLRAFNTLIYKDFPDVQTIAEDASDWPKITAPVYDAGYGFGMKWMIGWMNDILRYFKKLPRQRTRAQNDLTFSFMYCFDANFMLPFSHDEVVHGKSPMLYKMPGNEWEQYANLRLLYSFMYCHPGAKLLFMGDEFAQTTEWNYNTELDWELLQHEPHNALQECVRELNHIYRSEKALYELQFDAAGFTSIDFENRDQGILSFRRMGSHPADDLVIIMNVTNIPQEKWEISLAGKTQWKEIYNTDDKKFWGSGKFVNEPLTKISINKKQKLCKFSMKIGAFALIILK